MCASRRSPSALDHPAEGLDAEAVPFDPDVYRILKRFLSVLAGARIIELG